MDLHQAIKTVSHAMSTDAARINLCQILVAKNGDALATDGHRLALAKTDHTGEDLHIAAPIANTLRRLTPSEWSIDSGRIRVHGLGAWKPTDTPPRFPPYRQVLPHYATAAGETRTRKAWLEAFGEPEHGSVNVLDGVRANLAYLQDALKACGKPTDEITIVVGDLSDPIVIRRGDVTCIVMPRRG